MATFSLQLWQKEDVQKPTKKKIMQEMITN